MVFHHKKYEIRVGYYPGQNIKNSILTIIFSWSNQLRSKLTLKHPLVIINRMLKLMKHSLHSNISQHRYCWNSLNLKTLKLNSYNCEQLHVHHHNRSCGSRSYTPLHSAVSDGRLQFKMYFYWNLFVHISLQRPRISFPYKRNIQSAYYDHRIIVSKSSFSSYIF